MPALIKFVQLITKSHHDTVKQEAAEELTAQGIQPITTQVA